jgi:hypothetical protein
LGDERTAGHPGLKRRTENDDSRQPYQREQRASHEERKPKTNHGPKKRHRNKGGVSSRRAENL